jgi:hypothetical protein
MLTSATCSCRAAGLLLGAAWVFVACGSPNGEQEAGSGELEDVPCSQVQDELEEPRRVLAETFGDGPEGREANRALADTIEARPDCFGEDELEMARGIRDMLPASEDERAAVEEAEDACDGDVGGHTARGRPEQARHETPEDLLEAPQEERLPRGEPERATEGEGWIAFDYFDNEEYAGRAMVEQHDEGWFLRRVIHCGGTELIAE